MNNPPDGPADPGAGQPPEPPGPAGRYVAVQRRIAQLRGQINDLEAQLAEQATALQAAIHEQLAGGKRRFYQEIVLQQRQFRRRLLPYILRARPAHVITAPVIYSLLLPFALLDLFASSYQSICFRVYGIPRVRRRDHFVFDRHRLPYLNAIEKFNCWYCAYGNGLLAYVSEIAARTEQYWCPIKHARAAVRTHDRYRHFCEYGDAAGYREQLPALRAAVRRADQPIPPSKPGKPGKRACDKET